MCLRLNENYKLVSTFFKSKALRLKPKVKSITENIFSKNFQKILYNVARLKNKDVLLLLLIF